MIDRERAGVRRTPAMGSTALIRAKATR